MNQEMSTLFPNGIRVLVVDDEAKFLTTASMMLSIFDFKVSTCASPTSALNLLTRDKIKDVGVVLANAAKVAACGFDFRGIVESDLCIPVIYFLSLDHKATGDEANELLRTLEAGTCIIKKPLDADQVCDLWKEIAWRKCSLDAKANKAGRKRVVPAAAGEAGSTMVEEREEEERVHFKVVNTGGGARKRKSGTNNPGSSSGTSLAGDDPAKKQKQKNVTEGQEMGNVGSQQQDAPRERRSINVNKNTVPAPATSSVYPAPPVYQAPAYGNEACSLIQSLNLGTDDHDEFSAMVPMHTRFSNPPLALQNVVATAASNEATMAALYNNYCARALMWPQHIGRGVAANEAVAMGTLSSGGYIDYSAELAMAHQQADHGVALAPEEAASMEEATNRNSFSNLSSGSSLELNNDECFSNYSAASHSHMVPDQVLGMALNVVHELTVAGGASGSNVAAPAVALEVEDPIVAAPNGNQLAPGAVDNIYELLMEPQGPGAVMDGNPAAFDAEMFPNYQCEENIMFTLEELMGEDGQQDGATGGATAAAATNAAGTSLIGEEGGEGTWDMEAVDNMATGGAAAIDDAAGTSLVGEEGGDGIWDFGAADNLDDIFVGDLWNFTPSE